MKNLSHNQISQYCRAFKASCNILFYTLSFVCYCSSAFTQGLVINEIMPANSITFVDEDGDFSDWIELYNNSPSPISLNEFSITDDDENIEKWTFPDVKIEPYQFLILFASGKDKTQHELHTNFKLKSSGETLWLTSSDGTLIDQFVPPALGEDISFGRIPDGSDFLSEMYAPSPGISNNTNDGIMFSHESGYYQDAFQLSLQTQNAASIIYYTLDGSIPGPQSKLYNGSITIEDRSHIPNQFASINNSPYDFFNPSVPLFKGTVLRLQVFQNEVAVSPIVNKTYFVHPEIFTKYTLPIVSLITDPDNLFDEENGIYVPGVHLDSQEPIWTGNYFQRGEDWEREGVFQFFDLEGNIGLQQNFGLRIHGGKTRGRRQKSFRCYARKEYGPNIFQYRLIADKEKEEFKRISLQSPIGDWNNTMIKDFVTHEVCKGLEFDVQYTQPVILFLNGEYWGIYFLRDRYDDHYLEEEYGLDRDEVDILVHGSGIRPDGDDDWGTLVGENAEYLALMQYMNQQDMTTEESYDHFKSQVNINSLLDYYCTQIYFNNKDWPRNNHEVWRSQDEESAYHKWRWWLFDVDGGWGYLGSQFNLLAYASHPTGTAWQNPPYATFLLRKLLENPFFVDDFTKRFACLMNNEFHPDRVIEILDEIQEWLEPEMQDHINRWGYVSSISSWNSSINAKLRSFAQVRQAFMIQHLEQRFNIESFDLDSYCNPIIATYEPLQEQVLISPNPSRDVISVKFQDSNSIKGEAFLIDILGKKLSHKKIDGDFEFDLQNLAIGTYFLIIQSSKGNLTKKIIKI